MMRNEKFVNNGYDFSPLQNISQILLLQTYNGIKMSLKSNLIVG
jgi:hypothetical protein